MENVLIVKFGEIALRGKNRYVFENKLIAAIEASINEPGRYSVSKELGRYIVRGRGEFDYSAVIPRVTAVMGVVSCCPAVRDKDNDIENIKNLCLEYIKGKEGKTFKVFAKRAYKTYPLDSQQIAALIGGYILENTSGLSVKLKSPDISLHVEIRNYVYVYSDEIKGPGGLPTGTSGKALVLLSAGIDSPVAAYLMARRGVENEAVYFHSPPYTSRRALLKVTDICEVLARYTAVSRLHIVEFTDVQLLIKERSVEAKFTIMMKRSMWRIAERIAQMNGCACLAVGDSIGQVASQTLRSIAAIDSAVAMPVIRPLSGFDKHEITERAKVIGTYEISTRPFEDCCTLFVPPHPETKPAVSITERYEKRIDGLIEAEANVTIKTIEYSGT